LGLWVVGETGRVAWQISAGRSASPAACVIETLPGSAGEAMVMVMPALLPRMRASCSATRLKLLSVQNS